MHDPAHFLMGILLYKLCYLLFPNMHYITFCVIIFIISFLSHFLVDALADLTYHVPDSRPNDKFWLNFHIIIYVIEGIMIILILLFWIPYFIAIIGSIVIDIIDWTILRDILKKEPKIHPIIDKFRDKLFSWLPNLREKKWAVVNEIIFMGLLGIGIYLISTMQ